MRTSTKLKNISWWVIVGGISLILVVATILVNTPTSAFAGSILKNLNLAWEMNAGAWWSSMLLLMIALGAYGLASTRRDQPRSGWALIALIFVVLSWDEMGSYHERVMDAGWGAVLPFGAALLGALGYSLVRLYRNQSTRSSAIMLLVGTMLLMTIVPQEYLETRLNIVDGLLGIRAGIEEGIELLGMLLCLAAVARQYEITSKGIQSFTAAIRRLRFPLILLFAGLFLTIPVSFLAANFMDMPVRGDPVLWYASAVLLLLGFYSLAQAVEGRKQMIWAGASIVFFAASVGIVYLWERLIRGSDLTVFLLLGAFLIAVSFVRWYSSKFSLMSIAVFIVLTLVMITGAAANSVVLRYILTSVFVFGCAVLVLVPQTRELPVSTEPDKKTLEHLYQQQSSRI